MHLWLAHHVLAPESAVWSKLIHEDEENTRVFSIGTNVGGREITPDYSTASRADTHSTFTNVE